MSRRLPLVPLCLLPLCLLSCAPFQLAGVNKHGHEWALQSGGLWSNTKGVIQRAENGRIKLEQIVEEQDGTTGPQGVVDMKTTLGLAGFLRDERVNTSNNETKVKLGDQKLQGDKALLEAQGKAHSEALSAGAEPMAGAALAPGAP